MIEKAKDPCKNSVQLIENHFEEILDMVNKGSVAIQEVEGVKLS